MDNLFSEFKKPSWWISSFIMGILASLIAAFLFPKIEAFSVGYSKWKANRSEKERQIRKTLIESLASDFHLLILFSIRMLQWMIFTVIWLCLSLSSIIWFHKYSDNKPRAVTFLGLFALVALLMALRAILRAANMSGIIAEARQHQSKEEPSAALTSTPKL